MEIPETKRFIPKGFELGTTELVYEHYWLRFSQSDAIVKCERSRGLWVCKTEDCLGNDRKSAPAHSVST